MAHSTGGIFTFMQAQIGSDIEKAASILHAGGLVAIPTETVYGLGGDAKNLHAVKKIYAAKKRPSANPLIAHISCLEQLPDWAENIPEIAWKLGELFWPGPLTLILPKSSSVPLLTTGNQTTVGIRVPNHPVTLALLEQLNGMGIAAPSANRYGRISPTTTTHVHEELGRSIDYILEGGPCPIGIESTILYPTPEGLLILREGHISASRIEQKIGVRPQLPQSTVKDKTPATPGSEKSHYAPIHPLFLLERDAFRAALHFLAAQGISAAAALSFEAVSFPFHQRPWIKAPKNPEQYAQRLYANLRDLDHATSSCILVEQPPDTEPWRAVIDRLQRASTDKCISDFVRSESAQEPVPPSDQ